MLVDTRHTLQLPVGAAQERSAQEGCPLLGVPVAAGRVRSDIGLEPCTMAPARLRLPWTRPGGAVSKVSPVPPAVVLGPWAGHLTSLGPRLLNESELSLPGTVRGAHVGNAPTRARR